jgi:hypothetical protein
MVEPESGFMMIAEPVHTSLPRYYQLWDEKDAAVMVIGSGAITCFKN